MYNEIPLIKRQWELLHKANTLISTYEQGITELEAMMSHDKEEVMYNYEHVNERYLKYGQEIDELEKNTESLLKKSTLKGGTPKKLFISVKNPLDQIIGSIEIAKREYLKLSKSLSANTKSNVLTILSYSLASISLALMLMILVAMLVWFFYSENADLIHGLFALTIAIFLLSISLLILHYIHKERRNIYATILLALSNAKTLLQEYHNKALIDLDRQLSESERRAETRRVPLQRTLIDGFAHLINEVANYTQSTGFPGADWQDASSQLTTASQQLTIPSASSSIIRCGKVIISYQQQNTQPFPFFIPFPVGQSVLLQASRDSYEQAAIFLQSLLLRLITTQSPGMIHFTFFDPLNFGQYVAPFMQLSSYDPALVGNRIWTESNHIEQQLVSLSEYLGQVNQQYLWGATSTIEEYNRQNPQNPLPYRILVVQGFPFKFSPEAVRTLLTIARNGPRCGVYAIILCDMEQLALSGITLDNLNQIALTLRWEGQQVYWDGIQSELQAHSILA